MRLSLNRHNKWVILASLVASRTVYSINWFNISPALPLIAVEMNVSLTELGLIGTAFLLGVGFFQIPAGIVAAKINPRNSAILGIFLSSFFVILSGLAPSYEILLLTRFLTGLGMSFFFSPAIAFFSPLFKENEQGFAIGIFNSAFSIGGLLGLGVWSYLIDSIGWRNSLILSGALGIILAAQNLIITSGIEINYSSKHHDFRAGIKKVITHKDIWILAAALAGMGSNWYIIVQFIIIYLQDIANLTLVYAGAIAALLEVPSMLGGPIGGKISDLLANRLRILLLFNSLAAVGTLLISIHDISIIIPGILLAGFASGVSYTLTYSTASQYRDIDLRYKSLGISLINSTQLLGGSISPTLFAVIAILLGFSPAFVIIALLSVIPSVFLLKAREPFTTNEW